MWLLWFILTNTMQINKVGIAIGDVHIKIHGFNGLVTTSVLNTEIKEVDNKVLNA